MSIRMFVGSPTRAGFGKKLGGGFLSSIPERKEWYFSKRGARWKIE